jgi:putative hydrolase of the HAD superfamily
MTIFFDLDATLVDHESAASAGAAHFHSVFREKLDQDLEPFIERWHAVAEKYFQSNYLLECSLEEQRRLRMRALFPDPITDPEADQSFQVYLESYRQHWELYPDVLPCLASLQGRQLGLITNGDGPGQRAKVEKLGLGPYLSVVIVSREVDLAKPQKAIFELAAQRAGADPRDCAYVGDRLDADALASRQAGMKGVWLDRLGRWDGTDHGVPVIKGLDELPALL